MTARLDASDSDGPEAAWSRAALGDDPLTTFQPEPQNGNSSGDNAALRMDDIPSQAPSVPFATPSVNDGKPRTAGVVNRIKRVLRTLDIARDFDEAVDNRLAALRGFDQEVQDRACRLECLNREINVGAAHADDILRVIGSFEGPLADLRQHEQDLRAIETTVAAFENRAQTVSTSLDRHVAGCEAREAAVVDAVEQLGRRAAATIEDLEGHVGDCEARAHIAEQTITRLYDLSSRTLPALQERTKEAEEQNQSLRLLVTEASRMATSLTALEERLPAVGRYDQDLARIELAVGQIARQLEELNASAEQQSLVLAAHQQRVRQTLDESQKTADVVSELESRIVDLSGRHQQLDRLEKCIAELEQRAAAALGESTEAAHASNDLEQKIAVLQTQLRSMAETTQDEATKLVDLQRQAERCQQEHAQRTTAIVSGLEARLDAVRQEAERGQREETRRASALLAGLETRRAEIGRTHRELDVAERHAEQVEQRAAAAAGEVRQATRAKDELQREIAMCQEQIVRLTTHAQGEVLLTLRFRRLGPNTPRRFSRARLIFGGAAFALSAAIVLLVSIVWRISPVENQRPKRPLPAVVLASRALMLAPALAVAPQKPLTADIGHDRTKATRPARAVPAVVISETPAVTRGAPTAAVREQSVRKGTETPKFVGTLLIESDPSGAAVFVNQESVGDTPVLLKDLRAGSYVVRLEYEGYQRWSSAATVSAVRQERVMAKLERERSR